MTIITNSQTDDYHVQESIFGRWFLRSRIWTEQVIERALQDLDPLIIDRKECYPVVVDVGCGYGGSLNKLQVRFSPMRLYGLDIDPAMIKASRLEASRSQINAEFICCSGSQIELDDNCVDLLFCHQTFHHLVLQENAIAEFFRVLKPGGIMLFAESTKRYIHSWIIRLLFRHPMEVQKTADEYLCMLKKAGFHVPVKSISYPFLWWSREDLGIFENWFGINPPQNKEETLINLVATKPVKF